MRGLAGAHFEIYSAGTRPSGYVHGCVKEVLAEIGLDINGQFSKGLVGLKLDAVDYMVTLCGNARDECENLHGRRGTLHWPIDDLLPGSVGPETRLNPARRVRDEIRDRLTAWLQEQGIEPAALPDEARERT